MTHHGFQPNYREFYEMWQIHMVWNDNVTVSANNITGICHIIELDYLILSHLMEFEMIQMGVS